MATTTAEAMAQLRDIERQIDRRVAARVARLAAGLLGGLILGIAVVCSVLFAFGGDSSGAAQSSLNANVQRSAPPSGPSTWRDAKKTFGLLDPRTGAAAASGARFRVDALGALKWSLKLDFPTRSADDTLEVTAVCRRVDGGQSFSQKVSVHVNAGQESVNITGQVGASSSASWSPGRYRVEMSIDGQRVWQTEFDAYADEPVPEAKRSQPDRPSPRPAERVNRANKAAAERALDQ
jgi:hypothetical protein